MDGSSVVAAAVPSTEGVPTTLDEIREESGVVESVEEDAFASVAAVVDAAPQDAIQIPRRTTTVVDLFKDGVVWKPTSCPAGNNDICNIRRGGPKPAIVLTLAGPQQWSVQRFRCVMHNTWMRCVDAGCVAEQAKDAGASVFPVVYMLQRHLVHRTLLEYMWSLSNGGRCSAHLMRTQECRR